MASLIVFAGAIFVLILAITFRRCEKYKKSCTQLKNIVKFDIFFSVVQKNDPAHQKGPSPKLTRQGTMVATSLTCGTQVPLIVGENV